jgi:hypothetical protein
MNRTESSQSWYTKLGKPMTVVEEDDDDGSTMAKILKLIQWKNLWRKRIPLLKVSGKLVTALRYLV